jgi:hypothetical protein
MKSRPSSNRGWLSKIPRLHLNAVDVQVRHADVPRLRDLRRQAARINAETAVVEFVAAPMWEREAVIPITNASEPGGLSRGRDLLLISLDSDNLGSSNGAGRHFQFVFGFEKKALARLDYFDPVPQVSS